MDSPTQLKSRRNGAYIRGEDVNGSLRTAIHQRRKVTMLAVLGEFEKLIEPLVAKGNDEAIAAFKGVCRKKINGLAYEAIRASESSPGEVPGAIAADLAEDFAFDDTEEEDPT